MEPKELYIIENMVDIEYTIIPSVFEPEKMDEVIEKLRILLQKRSPGIIVINGFFLPVEKEYDWDIRIGKIIYNMQANRQNAVNTWTYEYNVLSYFLNEINENKI